jgi:Mrp family chromosome partitioning ATPase
MLDLAQIPAILARWWVLLVLGIAVGGGTGFAAVRGVPSVYQASVTLQLTRAAEAPAEDPLAVQAAIRTYGELVRTQPLLSQAAARAGLAASARELAPSVSAGPVRDTQLLRLTVEDTDRERVVAFASALAEVLIARVDETQASRFAASTAGVGRVIDGLRAAVEERETKAAQIRAEPPSSTRDSSLAAAEADLQEARTSYANAVRAQADVRLLQARSGESLAVVEPPQVPDSPIRPSRSRAVGLGMAGGFTVALAVVAAIVYWETRRAQAVAPARPDGLPVLAEVPIEDGLVDAVRAGHVAGCYRQLPDRIAGQGIMPRSILVTSAGPLQARGVVAANLAIALAEAGRRVVLVDANLREPAQAAYFGVPTGAGFSTLLFAPDKPCRSLLRPTHIAGLHLVTSGPPPGDPGTFLREHSARDRFADLYALAEVVVVDGPPISAGPDAVLLGLDTQATVLVVDAGEPEQKIDQLSEVLRSCGARPVGTIQYGIDGHEQSATAAPTSGSTAARPTLTLNTSRGE